MKTTVRTFTSLIITGVCALLALGIYSADAQGDDGTPTASPAATPSASPAASPAASTVFELKTGEMKFVPNSITIPANTNVTLKVTNAGVLPHDVNLPQAGVYSGILPSGASTELTLNLPPGTYQFFCTVPGHKQAGMTGTIVVE